MLSRLADDPERLAEESKRTSYTLRTNAAIVKPSLFTRPLSEEEEFDYCEPTARSRAEPLLVYENGTSPRSLISFSDHQVLSTE